MRIDFRDGDTFTFETLAGPFLRARWAHSVETFNRMRECWRASIPERYSNTDRDHKGCDCAAAAIFAPPPPKCLLDRFFAAIQPHLTEKQKHVQAARAACGRRSDLPAAGAPPKKPGRARRRPSPQALCRLERNA